jgi:putative iron-regulated protein
MKLALISALICSAALPAFAVEKADVVAAYADIAAATYEDSLITARTLQVAVEALITSPSDDALAAARTAWIAARVPYQQSEVFRFGNPIVDDWEGSVNAWPLDEGLIDYVDVAYGGATEENEFAGLNVIARPNFTLSGAEIDATTITPELIKDTLHEAEGIEENVASGYHAIEFLLWGQDLNGTDAGAGARPHTDYAIGPDCTGGNCHRRAAYLQSAATLLVSDLEFMAAAWGQNGDARANVLADPNAGVMAMLTGLGSLSYGELAGERMKLGLLLNDPEEEQDCFSDNTHNSHYYDGIGLQNVYLGRYTRVDGTVVSGSSLSDLVAEKDPALNAQLTTELAATITALGAIKSAAEGGFSYDQMLATGNAEGEALIMGGVNALITQTASIERAVTALGLGDAAFEGSTSLDDPNAVFQ